MSENNSIINLLNKNALLFNYSKIGGRKMKILLMSAGSRGDIEHFLAIEELLRDKGHEVVCAFSEEFGDLVDVSNARFVSLGPFSGFIESEEFKRAMGGKGSIFKKIPDYMKLDLEGNKDFYTRQHRIIEKENPDRIIFNWIATYPIIWGIKNKDKTILVSPAPCYIHYVKNHTDMIFHGNNYGSFLNKLTYTLANYLMWSLMFKGGYDDINDDEKIIEKLTLKQVHNALLSNKIIYTISPSLFPRPDYWPDNAQVLGYHERNNGVKYDIDEDLLNFMAKHDRILLITFGSMGNPEPEENTEIFLDVLQKHQIPAIINTASGGLIEPAEYDRNLIHFVKYIPYDWILPKIQGIVHHGGSGTTHLALKYGCPSMIIPHMIDQYVWSNVISELGAGPKGIGISKLKKQNLEPKLLDLFQNKSYKINAMEISENMKKEDFKEKLYKSIIE